jgi:hypothetical protein
MSTKRFNNKNNTYYCKIILHKEQITHNTFKNPTGQLHI